MKKYFSIIYKAILIAIIVFALYKEIVSHGSINFGALLYFTIQSNILASVSLVLFLFKSDDNLSILRGTALISITATGLVYNFVLYNIFSDWGTVGYTLTRTITHIVAPLGFIFDWLIFGKHGYMKWKHIFLWLLYPMIYGIISLHISSKTGKYLYFFLNSWDGINKIYSWLGIVTFLFVILSLVFIMLDKRLVFYKRPSVPQKKEGK